MPSQSLKILTNRAQEIANQTNSPRWIIYTSMGWRIEWNEPANNDLITFRFDPQPNKDNV